MSRALGAKVALMPSYEGWKFRDFDNDVGAGQ